MLLVSSDLLKESGGYAMSGRAKAVQLLDKVPEYKIDCIIAYIEGIIDGVTDIPNQETLVAFEEGDAMLMNGTGQKYKDIKALFADLEG